MKYNIYAENTPPEHLGMGTYRVVASGGTKTVVLYYSYCWPDAVGVVVYLLRLQKLDPETREAELRALALVLG